MTEQTWIDPRIDRSEWGAGQWDGEPDKVQWTDEVTGHVCLAKRNPRSGNWCGYVGVAPSHPWHGKDYDDLPDYGPKVHGGLTFSDLCQEGPPEATICHIPAPGEPDGLWWFGFDCHHYMDFAPGAAALNRKYGFNFSDSDESYKPLAYVKNECASLAKQLAAVSCS
jgi:hypothetical protein